MSRIEDDRQAQRTMERALQDKRLQESKTKQRMEGESSFSRLVSQQKAQQGKTQEQKGLAQSVLSRAVADAESGQVAQGKTAKHGEEGRAQLKQAGRSFDERVMQSRSGESQRSIEGRKTDASHAELASTGRQADASQSELRSESRHADAKVGREALEERGESRSHGGGSSTGGAQQAGKGKGELKADSEGGGGAKQGGDGKDQKGGGEMAAGFRFNPALMAPVPVARPKPSSGSDRLRQIANEIAQKIVERVRVGTNAAGNAEFQIDLRNDVLSGLSIKLSAKNGRIQAVFSGNDRDVLKMLEEQREGLEEALSKRGLTLEDLRIEAKT